MRHKNNTQIHEKILKDIVTNENWLDKTQFELTGKGEKFLKKASKKNVEYINKIKTHTYCVSSSVAFLENTHATFSSLSFGMSFLSS